MTPEQLEELADCADMGGYIGVELAEAIDAARADLAAMRQPITAEALVKAGWKESARPTVRRSGVVIFRNKDCSGIAAVGVFENGKIFGDFEIEAAGFLCRNVTTMYQLGQLVELLGGAE